MQEEFRVSSCRITHGFSDTVRGVEGRERELREKIKNVLGIAAKVTLVAPKTITRSEGKAVRVIDNRGVKGEQL